MTDDPTDDAIRVTAYRMTVVALEADLLGASYGEAIFSVKVRAKDNHGNAFVYVLPSWAEQPRIGSTYTVNLVEEHITT